MSYLMLQSSRDNNDSTNHPSTAEHDEKQANIILGNDYVRSPNLWPNPEGNKHKIFISEAAHVMPL